MYIFELKEQLLKYKRYILNKLIIYEIYTHTISMVGGEREFDFNVLSGCNVGVSQQINVSMKNLIKPPNPAATSSIKLVLSGSVFPLRLY